MLQRQRVLIIDNSKYFQASIWQLLLPETEFELIGLAGEANEAVGQVTAYGLDIALVDLGQAGMAGLKTIKSLRTQQPDLPIVALIPLDFEAYTRTALEAGATTCLEKSELADLLRPTIARLVPARSPVMGRPAWWQRLNLRQSASNPPVVTVIWQNLTYAVLGLVSGSVGVMLTLWLAVVVQSLLPPSTTFLPDTFSLLLVAALLSAGATWWFNRVAALIAPRLPFHLNAQAMQVVVVASTSTSVLQTLLFTRGW